MKKMFFTALLSCVFLSYSQAETWDIKADFPDAAGFTIPYNGWTTGVKVVKSAMYPLGDYNYNTFSQGYFDAAQTQLIYKLSHNQLTDPNMYAFINRSDTSTGGTTVVLKYGSHGCVAVKSYMDNVDLSQATEQYDGYLRWTAPAAGNYYIQLGMMYNGYVVKCTISLNGKALPNLDKMESTTGANARRISFFHPNYRLAAGDVLEMRFEPGGANAGWKVTRLFGLITPTSEFVLQDSFEDPSLPGWVQTAGGGGVVISDYSRTGTHAVEFPWGSGVDNRRMTLSPFAGASDGRNIELKIWAYDMPYDAFTHLFALPEIQSRGASMRLVDTAGTYMQILLQASNGQLVFYEGTSATPAAIWNSGTPPRPYALVYPDPGWNEFRATADEQGHVMLYLNDIPIWYSTSMKGIRDIVLAQWKGKVYEGEWARTIFDDLEIKYLEKDQYSNFPADPNIQNLNKVLMADSDLNRDYATNLEDFAVVAQDWLQQSETLYPVSISGGQFYTMEHGSFRKTIASNEIGGGFGRSGAALITTDYARSGNEALMVPKGRFGRVWRQFWGTSSNDCTATVWLYYPSDTYVGPLEVNLLDHNYGESTALRVYAGYQYDPLDGRLDNNIVKTTQGTATWTVHDPNLVQLDQWNKVQFVTTPEKGTDIYFNDTLIRNFMPGYFLGPAVMSVGKDFYYGSALPNKGLVIFDDMSIFENSSGGDPNAVYSAADLDLSGQIDMPDLSRLTDSWITEAVLEPINW